MEAFGQDVVAVLVAGDFEVAGEFLGHEDEGSAVAGEGLVEAVGEETGFEARGAEQGLLGEGDALHREHFLSRDRLVVVNEVLLEAVDGVEFLETDDGESGGGEAMLAGVLRRARLTFEGTGPGGLPGIRTIGSELLVGDRLVKVGQENEFPPISAIARGPSAV